jgi:hypothetical protein
VVVVVVKPRRDVTESTANHPDHSHYERVALELWCVQGARHGCVMVTMVACHRSTVNTDAAPTFQWPFGTLLIHGVPSSTCTVHAWRLSWGA